MKWWQDCRLARSGAVAVACTALALGWPARLRAQVDGAPVFSGYIRSGTGLTTEGGTQRCFRLPGAPAKYRLGNECEHLSELALTQPLARFADGSSLSVKGMALLMNQYGKTPQFDSSASDNVGFAKAAQFYASWHEAAWLNGGTLWAGRKYYRRRDIHISNFFYWNPTGLGAGVEDVGVGTVGSSTLKLSYAFFRRGDDVLDHRSVSRHDLQLDGIAVNPSGVLALGVSLMPQASGAAAAGWSATVQHTQRWGEQENRLALQTGRGSGTGLGQANLAAARGDAAWRLVNVYNWRASVRFDGQLAALWQRDRPAGQRRASGHWLSLGARGVYALAARWKLAVELGVDRANVSRTTSGTGRAGSLTKLTIAPIWAPRSHDGPVWRARPELRFYVTWARWSRAAQRHASAGSALAAVGPFGGARHGGNVGVQVEHWW